MKIIIGCSWGVGEWDRRCSLAGPGFGHLLMLHDTVVNLSIGNGSNTQSLDRLQQFFDQYSPSIDDDVYWVVTCPTRCRDLSWFLNRPGLQSSIDCLLDQSLARASAIASQIDIKINLIGGLCDLDTLAVDLYFPLNLAVPSWGRLLDQDYSCCRFMCSYWEQLGIEIKKQRPDLVDEWIAMSEKMLLKQKSWTRMSHSYFKTDGTHPDRDGHRKLRDHLWPEWAHKV